MPEVILPVGPASDGDGRRRPKTEGPTRNDTYWLDRIGTEWAKHLGRPMTGNTYRIDKLPHGYAGYEKARGGEGKHVDRYIYGHERGPARSMPDFMPHFNYLMDQGTATGCTCKLCAVGSRASTARQSGVGSAKGGSPAQQSPHFGQSTQSRAATSKARPLAGKPQKASRSAVSHSSKEGMRTEQVDEEGTPDALRLLLDKLQAGGTEGKVDEPIVESMSPDWRA
ncbi:hypothetical protein LTR53_009088, partial [Teratosphaeriaceae sp. CCFEE 6253]